LENVIEHGLIISRGNTLEIPEAYFMSASVEREKLPLVTLQEYEKMYIEDILEHAGGVIYGTKGAANILGLKPSTLQSRMKKLGIERAKKK